MVLFENLRRICREQHSILQSGMDQATLAIAFQSFTRLREFNVNFCSTLDQEDVLEYFIGMDMAMISRSYRHHFRTLSAALSRMKPSRLDVLHLSDLRIAKGLTDADTRDLSCYLQESLRSIRALKLTRSESALPLLRHCDWKIDQFDVCGMVIDYATLQGLIVHRSLCSLGCHDILISNAPPPLGGLPFLDISILRSMIGAIRKAQSQEVLCHCQETGHRILLECIDN